MNSLCIKLGDITLKLGLNEHKNIITFSNQLDTETEYVKKISAINKNQKINVNALGRNLYKIGNNDEIVISITPPKYEWEYSCNDKQLSLVINDPHDNKILKDIYITQGKSKTSFSDFLNLINMTYPYEINYKEPGKNNSYKKFIELKDTSKIYVRLTQEVIGNTISYIEIEAIYYW